jgi:hypothetical protein
VIKIEPQHTFLALWFISFPVEAKMDIMGAIWRDGDSGEYLGRYRFRYYDPLDPGNHPLSGKDRKKWFSTKYKERPNVTEFKEQLIVLAETLGGKLEWTDKERSGDETIAYLRTCPWAHWEQ